MLQILRFKYPAFLIAAALIAVLPDSASAQAAEVRPAPSPVRSGEVTITNKDTDAMRIEIRLGKAVDCDKNAPVRTRDLRPGATWSISASEPLCWRIINPKGESQSGEWRRHDMAPGSRESVSP